MNVYFVFHDRTIMFNVANIDAIEAELTDIVRQGKQLDECIAKLELSGGASVLLSLDGLRYVQFGQDNEPEST